MDRAIKHSFNKEIIGKIRLDNGWKEAWLLVLSDNTKVVFRSCKNYGEKFKREQFFYENANKNMGKICPEVYIVDDTCEFYHKSYQISEYIEGTTVRHYLQNEVNEQKKRELYYKIGETTANLNKINIAFDHPYVAHRSSWNVYFADELLRKQLEKIVKNNFITTAEIDRICSQMHMTTVDPALSFLHRDIRPDNMILHDGKIFVIDAETCEFGDPLNEIARINLEWHYWEMYEILMEGYKSVINIDTDSKLFSFYQLEQLGEILDMHYNHSCMNKNTPYFLDKFKQAKHRVLHT